MSINLSHGRAAILTISLAALLAACSGSTPVAPAAAATPASGSAAAAAPTSISVAGATDAAPPVAGGAPTAACSIVTSAAVSTATGFAVAKRSPLAAGQCMFLNADSTQYLTVLVYGSQADMAVMLEAESGSEHVAGLGDDAFWEPVSGLLFVRKGDHGMAFLDADLGSSSLTDTSGRDALVTLARTALPNL